jgi:hypothetical protein
MSVVYVSLCAIMPFIAGAQQSNGTITVTHEDMATGGGLVGSGNPMNAITVIGQPTGGLATNGTFTLISGSPTPTKLPAGTRLINVEGTTDDSTASVTVNGVVSTITAGTFRADGIQLIEGANTITATATDPAGNSASTSIPVFVDTQPPARPTVAGTPPVTTTPSYTLTGTKTPGTSVWINNVEVVPLGDATSWTATVSLVEGDNILVITAKKATGNESATNTINIIVDNLPPVISDIALVDPSGTPLRIDPKTALPKTNFSPATIRGLVDDSLTKVGANGILAKRSARSFDVAVPLLEGANTLTITATSPNGFVSTKTLSITLGTIPTITAVAPADGTKLYVGTTETIQAIATDKEQDPIAYQALLDGQIAVDWSPQALYTWNLTTGQLGLHTVEVRVRDAFGGFASKQAEVYVLRKPVPPP